jgi:hypothetical protein
LDSFFEHSFIISGGDTFFRKGPKESNICKLTLTFCTKDLRIKTENAIESSSCSTNARLAGVNLHTVEDKTTWGVEVGANYTETEGPPNWQENLEVVEIPRMAKICRRRTRLEGPPFGHGMQRQRRRGEPPRRS